MISYITILGPIALAFVGAIFLLIFLKSLYHVADASASLVRTGMRPKTTKAGGGLLVIPGLEKVSSLYLGLREAQLKSECVTMQGIKVNVLGVCMYKVGDTPEMITNAASRFSGQVDADIKRNIENLLDGHLRSIIGGMTVEDIIRKRQELTAQTSAACADEMDKMGLSINSLQIQRVDDPSNYIDSLAAPHVATVKQAARIAQATADQLAATAEAEQQAIQAASIKDSQVKQAGYLAETETAKAQAAQQGPLASAKAQQQVTKEQTALAQLEADRKEQELQTTVRKPADANAYAMAKQAEGARDAAIATATGEAKRVELEATAQATASRVKGEGEAAAIEAVGIAEGKATTAKVLADAAGIKARGEALAIHSDANINQTLAEHMPEIVSAATAPFASIKNLTVFDGAEGMGRNVTTAVALGATLLPIIGNALKAFRAADPGPDNGPSQIPTSVTPPSTK